VISPRVAYLDGAAPFTRRGRPDVVLLDLDLPGGGHGVLRHLRDDPVTAAIPVILLAGTPGAERVLRTGRHPVQGYATKPVGFHTIMSIVASVPGLGFEMLRSP
jgi:two-component system, chemotaxis family, response regulator Rcp1